MAWGGVLEMGFANSLSTLLSEAVKMSHHLCKFSDDAEAVGLEV
jgi:hypothetical protein